MIHYHNGGDMANLAKKHKKLGLDRASIKKRKAKLGSAVNFPDLSVSSPYKLSNSIPANGTKSTEVKKSNQFALVPAFNKGPIQPMTIEDLKQGAGRKI